ncbi:selenium cofactor biosynthesis protein YqeC [Halobellus ruber]|uniref:Putative selenium-dependent hydroxylase accessory protein YqeC n=1 Tax=Halobellus ruber TaxID=2761102 RepID=A0A7J9SNH7_9EURY|nr:selenium cofactor biosynthesis protein YqeC [Halobellus ruber]MBB6646731.1 putative selenium-dependent hydroxylase accessory protein YqeC [Halobellus ruber]
MDIVDALEAATGTTCVVGAGGKKTTMAALARRLDRAVVTATVRIPIFDEWAGRVAVTEDPTRTLEAALERDDDGEWPLGVVPEREREDRYRGYDLAVVDRLADFDVPVLLKADGARMRRFKAPDDHEPRLPATADTVVAIASVHVVGEPLSEELVHRVPEVSRITGVEPGEEIAAEDVAAVLASDRGGRKDVPEGATYVPLLNMVDDDALEAAARDVASGIHDRIDVPRVVLAEMRADDPVVDVV